MISLTDRIKVIVIRAAAGARSGPISDGCGNSALSYYIGGHLSLQLPSACDNFRTFYDPSLPRKVINVMNFCGAPSSEFFAFDRANLIDQLDLQCELQPGDEIVCLWKPLYALDPSLWFSDGRKTKSVGSSKSDEPASSTQNVAPTTNNPSASPIFRFMKLK